MNTIATFRKCTLTNEELLRTVDQGTDEIYKTGKIPTRNIPARPNEDYDLLVGELILRFKELTEQSQLHAIMQAEGSDGVDEATVASEGREKHVRGGCIDRTRKKDGPCCYPVGTCDDCQAP